MLSDFDRVTLITLMGVSVGIWLVPLTIYAVRRCLDRAGTGPCKRLGVSNMLIFSSCLLVAVWCLRYAVGYYKILFPGDSCSPVPEEPLYWWEEIFNSIVHALQTFSMDEDYTQYIRDGKEMVTAVFGKEEIWKKLYGNYASVLNFLSPIAGGAVVLEALARMFPKFQLRMTFWKHWRKKYYFSELNPASLALAKSIYKSHRGAHPVLVFTDTYIDDEQEKDYELLLEAKRYGAICVREDLIHVPKPLPIWSKREFYLMDENEFGNLQTLLGLVEDRNVRYVKDSCIYLFVQSDAYVQVEKQAKQILEEKKVRLGGGEKPIIVPVHGYRNLVQNLLNTVPLYEPLVGQENCTELELTILGNGTIGTEAFLCAYWMGQMMARQGDEMKPVTLSINVVSKDTPEDFWARIDYVNPEIRKTAAVEDAQKILRLYRPLLQISRQSGFAEPYCKVRYTQLDVKSGGFWTDGENSAACLMESDYYIVALGSDADNISVAEKLRCFVGKRHLEHPTAAHDRAVIAYAVFDSELAGALNQQKRFACQGDKTDIYMYAFGDLEQVYSCENVYMSKNILWAADTSKAYLRGKYDNAHRVYNLSKQNAEQSNYEKASYDYWANIARALHIRYKLFALGLIESSVFDAEAPEKVQSQCALYKLLSAAMANNPFDTKEKIQAYLQKHKEEKETPFYQLLSAEIGKKTVDADKLLLAYLELNEAENHFYQVLEKNKEYLAWLEHRRWNAFTRTMGYQYAPAQKVWDSRGDSKDMRLKLHACLTEVYFPNLAKGEKYFTNDGVIRDLLDEMTAVRRAGNSNAADYKIYDYYTYEFDNFKLEESLADILDGKGVRAPKKYCDHKYFEDAFCRETTKGALYFVPVESVQCRLEKNFAAVDAKKGIFEFEYRGYAPKKKRYMKKLPHKAESKKEELSV